MRIQNRRETFSVLVSSTATGRKHAGDLCENTDRINLIQIRDDIRIQFLILQQEGTNVRLSSL